MNQLICNPGFLHITTKILSHLDNKTQLTCRLGKSITNLFGFFYFYPQGSASRAGLTIKILHFLGKISLFILSWKNFLIYEK